MKDVHTEHCCIKHGCKYCDEDCTVMSGELEQSFMCEECEWEEQDPQCIRIRELEEMLRWYIEEDEINECDPENQYWIDGKHKAMRLLGMQVEQED